MCSFVRGVSHRPATSYVCLCEINMTQIKTFVVRAGLGISCVTIVTMVIFSHLKRITGSESPKWSRNPERIVQQLLCTVATLLTEEVEAEFDRCTTSDGKLLFPVSGQVGWPWDWLWLAVTNCFKGTPVACWDA